MNYNFSNKDIIKNYVNGKKLQYLQNSIRKLSRNYIKINSNIKILGEIKNTVFFILVYGNNKLNDSNIYKNIDIYDNEIMNHNESIYGCGGCLTRVVVIIINENYIDIGFNDEEIINIELHNNFIESIFEVIKNIDIDIDNFCDICNKYMNIKCIHDIPKKPYECYSSDGEISESEY